MNAEQGGELGKVGKAVRRRNGRRKKEQRRTNQGKLDLVGLLMGFGVVCSFIGLGFAI